jgi:hypothetical protein
MSEHKNHAPKTADDPAFRLPASLGSLAVPFLGAGLALLVAGWAIASFGNGAKVGMSAYLVAFIYVLTLTIGSLFFVVIQHLVRAGWSVVVRRIPEMVMVLIIPLSVLFLPILFSLIGDSKLYVWDSPTYAIDNHFDEEIWGQKSRWLTQGWFAFRSILYLAVFSGLAIFFWRNSTLQDETGQKLATDKMQYWAGPAVAAFALTASFAAFDWVMSLAPMWFSTMFGVYMFAGSMLATHCMICLSSFILQRTGALKDIVTVEHYHDLGKFIFGFTFFWTYISFSQFLLIWYANIPEETEWFYHRQTGNWGLLSAVIIVMHWAIPFAGTMSRHVRRRPALMAFWSAYLLIMHYVDVYWMIMPEANSGTNVEVTAVGAAGAVVCALGMVGLAVGLVLKIAQHNNIVPVRDPRLGESLAFENM